MDYETFLARKVVKPQTAGLARVPALNPALFPHQRHVVDYLLRIGRGGAFLDTGLGKTLVQLEWARVIAEDTRRPVLILAPLAVAEQTVEEGARFGIEVAHVRTQAACSRGINITNYERLDRFDPSAFAGVVLDESSILKSFMGATKRRLIEAFRATPFRLACTATPAPNDHMELGNHAEFLGVMASNEMLARWFINDTMAFGTYRLKGHAVESFWDWVSSWACCVSKPSDLGYDDAGFDLPPLHLERHLIKTDLTVGRGGNLFRLPQMSATAMHREKRLTLSARADAIASLVNGERDESWIVWCDTNEEADALTARIPDAIEVRGNQNPDEKARRLVAFTRGQARVIVTKPSIAGFGLNWQHCARMAFVGLSFSYEQFYQAVRRAWRFGQTRPVHVHVALAETEMAVWDAIARKRADHDTMKDAMFAATRRARARGALVRVPYEANHIGRLPAWLMAA